MTGQEGVALVVPGGFDAYARLLHPLEDGERWASVAPGYLRPGDERYDYPFPDAVDAAEGDMGEALVDALVPLLSAATTTPERCHYGLWGGWGELHPGSASVVTFSSATPSLGAALRSRLEIRRLERNRQRAQAELSAFVDACAVQPWWGGRDMLLFDGPLDAVAAIGSPWPGGWIQRRSPQWWWPADKRWFVATEIDYPWTYVAGPTALIEAIMESPTFEAVRVQRSDLW
jgi:hypothetical protein